jgi:RNA polymerase sigma factor for flagellar operon FliA
MQRETTVVVTGKTDEAIRSLWISYKRRPTEKLRNKLIECYLPVVRKTAQRLRARLPREVDEDDLHQAGVFGLMRAIDSFEPDRGVRFASYATFRIRGSILDEIRSMDWVPRLVRSRCTQVERARRKIQQHSGSAPAAGEVANALGVDMKTYLKMARDARPTVVVSMDAGTTTPNGERPGGGQGLQDNRNRHDIDDIDRTDLRELLSVKLNRFENQLLQLYYNQGLTMREIGTELHLSESRICQLHGSIIRRLRDEKELIAN